MGLAIEPKYHFRDDNRPDGVLIPAKQLRCIVIELIPHECASIKYELLSEHGEELFWGVLKMEGEDYQLWDNDSYVYTWIKAKLNLSQ